MNTGKGSTEKALERRTPAFLLERQRAMAMQVAAQIQKDPQRSLEVIQDNLRRWMPSMDPATKPLMEPWIAASHDAAAIVELLLRKGERADWLRSVAPTAGILTQGERLAFLRDFDQGYAANSYNQPSDGSYD